MNKNLSRLYKYYLGNYIKDLKAELDKDYKGYISIMYKTKGLNIGVDIDFDSVTSVAASGYTIKFYLDALKKYDE